MKTHEIVTIREPKEDTIAEILNNYNHPKFDLVFEMIMKEYNGKQSPPK